MKIRLEKSKENSFPTNRQKSRAVANSLGQKSSGEQGLGFVDNRAPSLAQNNIKKRDNNPAQFKDTTIQRGDNPIDESKGIKFEYGLIHGTYVPKKNEADMHVSKKSIEKSFSLIDVYKAFTFVYSKMVKQKKSSQIEGVLIWNPQGAAVIKMVAELIGESLGNSELLGIAKLLKEDRKRKETEETNRDSNIISEDIIPEHLQYLRSAIGAEGVHIKPVIPGNMTEENFDSDMLIDNKQGRARFEDYRAALESGIPVSLRIQIGQTQLGTLIKTLED